MKTQREITLQFLNIVEYKREITNENLICLDTVQT